MTMEVIKRNPNFDAIESRMDRTFNNRRNEITSELTTTITQLLSEYPALKDATVVN